jgi:Fe-S cluster assembly iron-binding protein IscA
MYLKIIIDSGGCSGFSYSFKMAPTRESDDM